MKVDYDKIESPELKKHIDDEGVILYSSKKSKAWPWLLISVLIIAFDQLTKFFILKNFTEQTIVHVFPCLNFILSFNAGASFGFLGAQNGWQVYLLSGISILVATFIIVWLMRLPKKEGMVALPMSLVLGGAIGNLIDRVRFGYVTDFIDFHVKNWHFATFNIADSAVTIGATWLIVRLCYESVTRES